MSWTNRLPVERWDGTACGVATLAAILLVRPFLEMGLIDDFSYIQTAFVYARTGHFVYNGWATAMLGWQIPYGALFVKLFGEHVWALHLSTLIIAVLTAPLLRAVMRRSGLRRGHAFFATLLTCLSPIFLPLASSYMTDIGGLFTLLLCWYALLRALDAESDSVVWLWLTAACAASTLGGTARQIVWVGALTMMPASAWLLRKRRGVLPLATLLWVVSLVCIFLCLNWYKQQPLAVPEPLVQGRVDLRQLRQLACTELSGLLCLLLLTLPALVACLPTWRRWSVRQATFLVLVTLPVTLVARFICSHLMERGWMPWTGDVVGRLGIVDYPGGFLLGVEPMMFSLPARIVGSFLVIAVCLAAGVALQCSRVRLQPCDSTQTASWHVQATLLGGLLVGYLGLLLPRATWFEILDRYLLPLIPVLAFLVLRLHQERVSLRIPRAAWCALALWVLFAITGTHDWLQTRRARLTAMETLSHAGIRPEHVNAGYEINAATQIRLAGAIIDPRVTYPPGLHLRMKPNYPDDLPPVCRNLYYASTPMIEPQFFLSHQVVPCLQKSRFGAVPYRTWQPPYNRSIMILERRR